jgi:hypothetical protein
MTLFSNCLAKKKPVDAAVGVVVVVAAGFVARHFGFGQRIGH